VHDAPTPARLSVCLDGTPRKIVGDKVAVLTYLRTTLVGCSALSQSVCLSVCVCVCVWGKTAAALSIAVAVAVNMTYLLLRVSLLLSCCLRRLAGRPASRTARPLSIGPGVPGWLVFLDVFCACLSPAGPLTSGERGRTPVSVGPPACLPACIPSFRMLTMAVRNDEQRELLNDRWMPFVLHA